MRQQSRRPTAQTIQFRLSAPALRYSADVHLRDYGHRWLAMADIDGRREVGVGATAREALTASLSRLGPREAGALLADPGLFAVSCTVHRLTAVR
jgi:hypothetical protein